MTRETPKQVAQQCRAVAYLAQVMADLYRDKARLYEEAPGAMAGIVCFEGPRSAAFMEMLADWLNEMDAATEDDQWLTPIFEEAHRLYGRPARPGGAGE